jgi:hypothetical protein
VSPRAVVDQVAQTLGRIIMDAVAYVDGLKAKGATKAETDQALENVIRAAWPKPKDRVTPWRYGCETCGDTGLVLHQCHPGHRCDGSSTRTEASGDRPGKYTRFCVGSSTYEHDYGVPCLCAKGHQFRRRGQQTDDEAAFVAATKSKPKPLTRWGR